MNPAKAHGDDFARSCIARSCRGGPSRTATLLIVSPRAPGEGSAYGTQALAVMPTTGALLDYLFNRLPPGSTLSIHAIGAVRAAPARPLLRLV